MIKRAVNWYKRPNKSWLAENVESLLLVLFAAFLIRTFGFGLYQVPTGSMETTMLVGERFIADKFSPFLWGPQRGNIISFNDPTFQYSDNLVVNFFQRYVWGPSNWTKRIIGIPGDHMVGRIEDGVPVVYVNDQKLDEPYTNKYQLVPVAHEGKLDWKTYDPASSYDNQPFYNMNESDVRVTQRLLSSAGYRSVRKPGTPLEDQRLEAFDITLGKNQYWAMGDNRLGSWDSRAFGPLNGQLIHGRIVFRIFSIDSDWSWLPLDMICNPISFWNKIRWNRLFQVLI